jgi:hypothetical protein
VVHWWLAEGDKAGFGPRENGALPRALEVTPQSGINKCLSVLRELLLCEGALLDGRNEVKGVH